MREGHRRGGVGWLAVGLGVWLAGCAASRARVTEADLTETLDAPGGQYHIRYAPSQAADAARIQRAVDAALPRLAQWGSLREPVTLQVLPDHASLESAVRQHGYAWLRAWSRYDEVFLQAPSSWGLANGTQAQLDELLLHELTHSLMYQLAADRLGWSRKQIPLWFREGMASYTAEQGYRWVSLEEVARHLDRDPGSDPMRRPEPLYRDDSNLVYGMAHHAFTFLVRRYGVEAIQGLLREMKAGLEFPAAFTASLGLTPDAFARDFTRYVRLRGFRGGRLPPRAPERPAPPPES